MPTGSEVTVHGGGVAGNVAAILMVRAGLNVVQFVSPGPRRPTPFEILSPWTRTLLHHLELPEPDGGQICEGVLSHWSGPEADYHDYSLANGMTGLAVRRESFHFMLGAVARRSGVRRIQRARAPSGAMPGHATHLDYQLFAHGRSARTERSFEDRLVALFTSCTASEGRRLLVEPAPDGWWYLPPPTGQFGELVFVTDPLLVPKDPAARAAWLGRNLAATRLLAEAVSAPRFDEISGMDARVACAARIVWPGGARIGDAALSLDPLSGTGVGRALEGAAQIARDMIEHGAATVRYGRWVLDVYAEERATRALFYRRAAMRFPTSSFWRRDGRSSPGSRQGQSSAVPA